MRRQLGRCLGNSSEDGRRSCAARRRTSRPVLDARRRQRAVERLDVLRAGALVGAAHQREDRRGDVREALPGPEAVLHSPGASVEPDRAGEPVARGSGIPRVRPPKQKPTVKIDGSPARAGSPRRHGCRPGSPPASSARRARGTGSPRRASPTRRCGRSSRSRSRGSPARRNAAPAPRRSGRGRGRRGGRRRRSRSARRRRRTPRSSSRPRPPARGPRATAAPAISDGRQRVELEAHRLPR